MSLVAERPKPIAEQFDLVAFMIDESYAWTDVDELKEKWAIDKFAGVYVANRAVGIHVCSMTASLEAYFVRNAVVPFPPIKSITGRNMPQTRDWQIQAAQDYVDQAVVDEYWTYFPMNIIDKAIEVDELEFTDHDEHVIKRLMADYETDDPLDDRVRGDFLEQVAWSYSEGGYLA